jgi:glutamate formiminotransferase
MTLLGVPNVSEGHDRGRIAELEGAFADGAALLDSHSDPIHNRSVFTLAGDPGTLASALLSGAAAAVREIDITRHKGAHPCIGALDVCPVVWVRDEDRAVATEEALEVARRIGVELRVPVFLYGEPASAPRRRERSFFRDGGLVELRSRMGIGQLRPDEGPSSPHPTAGATLVTARPPLAAFNIELDTGDLDVARAVAGELREGGGGLPGVRAIGVQLNRRRTQVSTNVHDPAAVSLGRVIEEVRRFARVHGPARPIAGEVVGLVPEAALEGLPDDVPLSGFDPARQVIERRLASAS